MHKLQESLPEKHCPSKIKDFVGLAKPKQILTAFARSPFPSAWLFTGRSGSGKSAMAAALAFEISAQLHRLPAEDCTRDNLRQIASRRQRTPSQAKALHLVLVDQADKLTKVQQTDFRAWLDHPPVDTCTVWVFTAVSSDLLDEGFVSRCHKVPFSTYGISKEAAALLENVWSLEVTDPQRSRPNFGRIVKESNNDIRTALLRLETELIS